MILTFKELKKQRDQQFNKIANKHNKIANPGGEDDPRFWQPVADPQGNGFAIIRFLPVTAEDEAKDPEAVPFVQYFDHGFKGPGGWYIQRSLTSIGKKDPCAEMNSRLWNSKVESEKLFVKGTTDSEGKQVPGSKRRTHFIANIFVVKHPNRPEDEGKNFLFKFGKKLYEKVALAQNPKTPDQEPFDPFNLWEGANFRLTFAKVDGQRSYNESSFGIPAVTGPLLKDEDKMEEIWKKAYPLNEFTSPDWYKSYDVLKADLERVMGFSLSPTATKTVEDQPQVLASKTTEPPFDIVESPEEDDEEADDQLASFRKLIANSSQD